MCHENIVSHDPWLCRAVANGTFRSVARAARSKSASVVAQNAATPWLIESDPVLDLGAKGFENQSSIVSKVGDEFLFVQKSAIPLVQFFRQVPMEECYHGRDTGGEQVIHEFEIELQAFLIDWVVATPKGNDARPIPKIVVSLAP